MFSHFAFFLSLLVEKLIFNLLSMWLKEIKWGDITKKVQPHKGKKEKKSKQVLIELSPSYEEQTKHNQQKKKKTSTNIKIMVKSCQFWA